MMIHGILEYIRGHMAQNLLRKYYEAGWRRLESKRPTSSQDLHRRMAFVKALTAPLETTC